MNTIGCSIKYATDYTKYNEWWQANVCESFHILYGLLYNEIWTKTLDRNVRFLNKNTEVLDWLF